MINIKEKIGQRILEARKEKGFTRKELAELTHDLKQSRINNWERGLRTPGPEEIKQLAQALDVSPSYLMCLTDVKESRVQEPSMWVPLLDYKEALEHPDFYLNALDKGEDLNYVFISISRELIASLSQCSFALKVKNDSMAPEIRPNDILIFDNVTKPNPGDYVAVKVTGQKELIICQYKKLSYVTEECEFITLNENWPNIKASKDVMVSIIGTVMQMIRTY